jgi:hypothetical protein
MVNCGGLFCFNASRNPEVKVLRYSNVGNWRRSLELQKFAIDRLPVRKFANNRNATLPARQRAP